MNTTQNTKTAAAPFAVGDGVHYRLGSHVIACTVREVARAGRTVRVSQDRAVATTSTTDAITGHMFEPVDESRNQWETFTRRRNGEYVLQGESFGRLKPGRRDVRDLGA